MQWLIVVLFATVQGDIYIFANPTFDSREECMASITNPAHQKNYIKHLVEEYKKPMPIMNVNCLSKEVINKILNGEKRIAT